MIQSMKVKSFVFAAWLLVGMGLLNIHGEGARAGWFDCVLPVCDIDGVIDDFRYTTQSSRHQYVSELKARFSANANPRFRENLKDFGIRAKQVMLEMGDEDWVIREVDSLIGESLLWLIINNASRPQEMIGYFEEFRDEDYRYKAMDYWVKRIDQISDITKLQELVEYASNAERICKKWKDSASNVDMAIELQAKISTRLLVLYPFQEGIYRIQISCQNPFSTYCERLGIDQLVILDSMDRSFGIILSVSNTKLETPIYWFENSIVSGGGLVFEGRSDIYSRPAKIRVEVHPSDGTVSGLIFSPETPIPMMISGKITHSVGDSKVNVGGTTAPIETRPEVNQIPGVYKGRLFGKEGRITIVDLAQGQASGQLVGIFKSNDGLVQHYYQVIRYVRETGTLNLIAPLRGVWLKASLRLQTDGNWKGSGYTGSLGRVSEAELVRVK